MGCWLIRSAQGHSLSTPGSPGSGLAPRDLWDHSAIEVAESVRAKLQDAIEAGPHIMQQLFHVDAKRHRPVAFEKSRGIRKQIDGALVVITQDMMKAGGDLDNPLVEVSQRTLFSLAPHFPPDVFQRLVTIVEAPAVELRDALRQRLPRVRVEICQRRAGGHRHQYSGRRKHEVGSGGSSGYDWRENGQMTTREVPDSAELPPPVLEEVSKGVFAYIQLDGS